MKLRAFRVISGHERIAIQEHAGHTAITIPTNVRKKGTTKELIFDMYGLYGSVNFKHGRYLICVTDAEKAGEVEGHAVYEIKQVRLLKYRVDEVQEADSGMKKTLSTLLRKGSDHSEILLLEKFFRLPGSYFSDFPIYESVFNRRTSSFVFNKALIDNLENDFGKDMLSLVLRSMHGYFASERIGDIEITLVSRRSRHRAGVRFFSRGADSSGYVSNFVETTQYINKGNACSSYVQIRGSIPLKWRHKLNFKYHPMYVVDNSGDILNIADKKLEGSYGSVFYLNLTREDRYEKDIFSVYLKELESKKKRFLHFDFDGESLGVKKCAMEKLESKVAEILKEQSFFSEGGSQNGVIRSNCIDTLDRTNVTQFIIGRLVLKEQLGQVGSDLSEEIGDMFKKMWYDNGNTLSIQYSGTPSVKSQIVLSNSYSKGSLVKDFIYSCKRYLINRFDHGNMQNAYEIITGKLREVRRGDEEHFKDNIRLFLLIFILVSLSRVVISSHKNKVEAAIELAISLGFFTYLLLFSFDLIDKPYRTKT